MAGILDCFDKGSLLEKIIGKRQSVIFGLLVVAVLLVRMGEGQTAAVIVGFVGLLVKDYIEDVGSEKVPA